jgi:hypothetical protein
MLPERTEARILQADDGKRNLDEYPDDISSDNFSATKKSENVSRRKHSIADEFANWFLPCS